MVRETFDSNFTFVNKQQKNTKQHKQVNKQEEYIESGKKKDIKTSIYTLLYYGLSLVTGQIFFKS